MGYLSERASKKQENAARAATQNTTQKDEWLATMSNPDSNIDELGTIVRWIILPLFAVWVWYIGYLFTSKELVGVVDPWQVTLLAFLLPGTVQFLKLYGAKKALRAFHFKWFDRSAHDFYLWVLVGAVVVLMFGWSLKISIFDVKDTARENYVSSNSDSLNVLISSATSGLDAQISALNASNERAGSMKTKKGKIAWSGQSIEMNNSATLSALNAQKSELVNQTIADYKAGKVSVEKSADHRGNFFQRFGGFGEVGEILFCLILGLIEAINRNANSKRLANQATNEAHYSSPSAPAQNGSTSRVNNNAHPNPIGFRWDGYGNPQASTAPTVPQSANPVAQHTMDFSVIGCDAVLKNCKQVVQRDLTNFGRNDANPATVSGRINKAMDDAFEIVSKDGFSPSYDVALSFYKFLAETAIPTLNDRGWPYSRDTFFMKRILAVIPKLEHA